jgi:phage terminase large subunit-like protein
MLGKLPEALAALDARQYAGIGQDWFALWARDDQMPPMDGNWRNWLILGGRGAGKTRAGAEWVKARATGQGITTGPLAKRIALVAPTIG